MQSVSPSSRFQLALVPRRVWGHTRASMTGAVAWSAVLILLLTLMVARSTATAAWVGGIDVVTLVALGGAVLMGVLAVSPVPWTIGLGLGLVAGPVVAAIARSRSCRRLSRYAMISRTASDLTCWSIGPTRIMRTIQLVIWPASGTPSMEVRTESVSGCA